MNFWKYITNSTLKREYAAFLTFWLLAVATYLVALGATDMQFRILELFTYPIMIGAFGAFGLDFIAKQTNLAGPSKDATETKTTTSVDMPAVMTVETTTTTDEAKG